MLTPSHGKYFDGNEVVFYEDTKKDFQKFRANSDGTMSPKQAPEMVLGMTECKV